MSRMNTWSAAISWAKEGAARCAATYVRSIEPLASSMGRPASMPKLDSESKLRTSTIRSKSAPDLVLCSRGKRAGSRFASASMAGAARAYSYRDQSGVVRRCRQVSDNGGRFGGYDVTYRYAGQTYHALMNYRPGRTMRVMVQVRPQFERGMASNY